MSQKEPKRSQINPHLDHETAVDILLEEAAYRCFDLASTDLAHLSPNRATHLKSPEKLFYKHTHIHITQTFSATLFQAVFIHQGGVGLLEVRVGDVVPGAVVRPAEPQHLVRDVELGSVDELRLQHRRRDGRAHHRVWI